MPIARIERQLAAQGVLGNFPRLGKLRKGGEKTEKSAGRDLDYFRVTFEPQYEHLREPFVEQFGDKSTEFRNVFLAADSADQAFKYFYEQWAHARLLRRCDGEQIGVEFIQDAQYYSNTPRECTCDELKPDCKLHGRLDIVLPEFFDRTGVWGKFTIETHSIYDVIAIRSAMIVAGTFAASIPQTAFWSIPFRIGRAMRPVPVTINGKRSIKPMSLLFAEIEPEFNQKVVNPRLTAPTQKLLAGVNAETGELPEVIIEQPAAWDRDYVNEQTLHLFDHENHQTNAINQMIDAGLITDDMSDETVIARIQIHRAQRDAEKQTEQPAQNAPKPRKKGSKRDAAQEQVQTSANYSPSTPALQKIVEAAIRFGLTVDDVFKAVSAVSPAPMQSLDGFAGTPQEAWAACVAYKAGYSLQTVAELIPDPENAARKLAEQIIHSKQPF